MTNAPSAVDDAGLLERITAAAQDADAQLQVYEDARKLRDELILDADALGIATGTIARAALMSPTRVGQIIAKSGAA